ncbi:MAG TPA: 2Fe-2S iron-sulfur cluster-binding protein [Bacillota bacterium]|nr:2Fe-2S iron-sulfur cluster-binding protein [Bacillota bacterium]
MKITMILNGNPKTFDVACGEMLLDTLRNHGLLSVRRGCESTSCGICTVLLDGKPVPSCSVLSVRADGRTVTTVEGIPEEAEKLSHHFGEEGADQCGFCNPSLALAVYALKQTNPKATPQEIETWLVGNLCRCSGYQSQHAAIQAYLKEKS